MVLLWAMFYFKRRVSRGLNGNDGNGTTISTGGKTAVDTTISKEGGEIDGNNTTIYQRGGEIDGNNTTISNRAGETAVYNTVDGGNDTVAHQMDENEDEVDKNEIKQGNINRGYKITELVEDGMQVMEMILQYPKKKVKLTWILQYPKEEELMEMIPQYRKIDGNDSTISNGGGAAVVDDIVIGGNDTAAHLVDENEDKEDEVDKNEIK
ncbi:hypothetical protein AMTR_s00241p00020730 [Amborella trichopoda]|uniref:Uncharacterized protein n=1 Tax=Amborella trichopoda TaxID=13333 RepID=W1NTY5_AMBTC|nr:hypothetical protein AMTR_s00241p00020730 [Amborella trichopoda]